MRSNAWTTAGLGAAVVFSLIVWPGLISYAQQGTPRVTVYKSPTCGCCSNWVEHMKKNGFVVTTQDVDDVDAVKMKHGVPPGASSCHTAIVDGYVVEGHVPADAVKRMLKERPQAVGIAVPGMPVGSPGMEQGEARDPYDVVTFDRSGKTSVYERR
jgi:hypothetical protein